VNEAELVYSHILNCDRLSLYLNKDAALGPEKCAEASRILKRRITGEPLQYILGVTEFMGLKFNVDSRALIPRPETELLVNCVLEKIKSVGQPHPRKILDLGTGSGCIAVSLAKLLPHALVWASDISLPALQLAKANADLHKVKVRFFYSDIFRVLEKTREKFDLIVSNPPYISSKEFGGLAREISFEPALALAAGVDGLELYRSIIRQSPGYLKESGLLILEMGAGQRKAIENILKKSKKFEIIEVIKDYNSIDRIMVAQKH